MAFPENTVNDIGIKHIWDKVTAALSGKVDKVSGKGLSTNDYTTAEKEKLSGIEAGAQVNTVTSVAGKTGAVTLDKSDVGLGNVDNTSDLDKPISTATQTALNNKADSGEVEGLKTATGKPITLTDASETYAQGLSVEFEPKQDLHGYDFPWVGGAGKNKLPITVANLKSWNTSGTWSGNIYSIYNTTIEIITDETNVNVHGLKINTGSGGASDVVIFKVSSESQTFHTGDIISGCPTGGATNKYMLNIGGTNDSDIGNGGVCSSDIVGVMNLDIFSGVQLTNSMWYPMVSTEGGTFAPYSNICPISGYEGVEVEDVGDNLYIGSPSFDGFEQLTGNWTLQTEKYNGHDVYKRSDTWGGCYKLINLPVGTYTFSVMAKTNDGEKIYLYPLLENVTTASVTPAQAYFDTSTSWHRYYYTFNVTVEGTVAFRVERATSGDVYISEYQLEKGTTTPTDYHPYQSRTASVTFGQTVYGGRSDFTDGGTDDEWENVDLGDLSWTYSQYERFEAQVSNVNKTMYTTDDMLCSCFKPDYSPISASGIDGTIAIYSDGSLLVICKEYTDASTFKTAMTGQTVCYKKATPTTLATPKTDLKLLQDTNNLTTNGTTITLDYIPNNSIGDAVKASEEYTDRAVERVIPKAKLACFYEIFDESGTLYDATIPEDCNFFLVEYRIQNRIGSTLISAKSIDFYIPVVVNVGGDQNWVEFLYNSIYHTITYTSNVTTGFGVLSIYTI